MQVGITIAPLGCHWHNIAEVAITTFKAHFIAILAGLPINAVIVKIMAIYLFT